MTARDGEFRDLYRELRIADQRTYYDARSNEYADAHRQTIVVRNALLLLAAVAGIAGQLLSGSGRAGLSVVAAVLAALAGAVTAFEALIAFPQLHKLYDDAALNLATAAIDWDAGADGDLAAEFERVEQIFRAENGQWGQLVIEGTQKAPPAAKEGES